MKSTIQSIGIAGAGLLGRLLAWRLAHAGHAVQVFDVAAGPQPVFRSQAPDEGYVPTAAGFTAAGMLSPMAELDNAEPAVAALGWRSIALWRQIVAALPAPRPLLSVQGSVLLAHRGDAGAGQRVLDRLMHAAQSPQWPREHGAIEPLSLQALRELEPSIQGPAQAWLLPGEGHIDTVATMLALQAAAPGVRWHWGAPVAGVQADEGTGVLHLADGRALKFDAVIDVRGVGARGSASLPEAAMPVRGVRGEVIGLHCPGHGLTRQLRLLHPRHRVYVVPRSADLLMVGASEIESEDRSPVSLRSAVELMAAAHSVLPALAEARIVRLDVNLRPALPDNNPRIEHAGRRLAINGLFRHGWLLAPALVEQALAQAGWAAPAEVLA
ncbi:MAG: FAD-dependent oxidoreductase [Ottowia sp.]|nr:FAD-dependent oxidoreductase [Pseudomonadota bacterium]MBS0598725.1 FAD-dependent oxidoreductase [Pseudomonadota bacterium]